MMSISERAQQRAPQSLCYAPSTHVQLWNVAPGSVRYSQNPVSPPKAVHSVKAGGSCPRTDDFRTSPTVPVLGYPPVPSDMGAAGSPFVGCGWLSSPGKLEWGLGNRDPIHRHPQVLQKLFSGSASSLKAQGGQRDLQGQTSALSTIPATSHGSLPCPRVPHALTPKPCHRPEGEPG